MSKQDKSTDQTLVTYVNETIGFLPGSRWQKPSELKRAAAIAFVSKDVSLNTAFVDGSWFYSITSKPSITEWICKACGLPYTPPGREKRA